MWQYLDAAEQARMSARLSGLGATATDDAPLAHIAFEPRRPAPGQRHRFLVTVTTWPGGHARVVGEAPHGVPVTWSGAGPVTEATRR